MKFFLKKDIEEILERSQKQLDILNGKKILLAGSKGFLGRYFNEIIIATNKINKSNISITAIDNFISSSTKGTTDDESDKNINFVEGDICDYSFVKKFENFDYVIHAAGIASPFYYRSKPLETVDVSVIGSRNLLEISKKSKCRFIFFSSSEIYGDPDPEKIPIQESYRGNVSTIGPRACYDESKRLGETLCHIYNRYHGIHTNIIRPFNIYGPGMQEHDYRVMPNFASKIKLEENLKLYGSANQTRTFCYITDAIDGFLRVITSGLPGEPYNIGNPKPEITINQLADIFIKIASNKSSKDVIEYPDSYPADEPMRRCPDIKKARLQLDFHPAVDLEDGIQRFLSWTNKQYKGE